MCKRRSVVYLANWTWYEIARGVFATATNEGGAKIIFGPPLRGSVRSPHKKVKANLFWGALGQPLKKQPSGGWSKRLTWSSKTSVGHHVTHMCYRLAYRLEQLVNNCYVFVRSVQGAIWTTTKDDLQPWLPTPQYMDRLDQARPAAGNQKEERKPPSWKPVFLPLWSYFINHNRNQ